MEKVESVLQALQNLDIAFLFDVLGVRQYPIAKKSQKKQWHTFENDLLLSRNKLAIDVLTTVIESKLIPIPKQIYDIYLLYSINPESLYGNSTIKNYLNTNYSQFLAAIDFLYPETEFSTDHGVKGKEYDNVIFANDWRYNYPEIEAQLTKERLDVLKAAKTEEKTYGI